jgi:uncharacterized protein involved in exopolysaccharide biosynthesis
MTSGLRPSRSGRSRLLGVMAEKRTIAEGAGPWSHGHEIERAPRKPREVRYNNPIPALGGELRKPMIANNQNRLGDREFSLRDLLGILWRGKWTILWATATCAVVATVAAWIIPKQFDAVVIMAPVTSTSGSIQTGGLSALASQFGGLAGLAGLGANGDSKKSESIALLQSEALTERYIKENNLLPVLNEKKWDSQKMQWKVHDPEDMPTLWKGNQQFKNIRSVTTDQKTGLVTLKITWDNPNTAAQWANGLVRLTNDYVRNKAIAESERNIAFLTDEGTKTNIVEARQAIYQIMQKEINTVMLARGSEEYAFKVLDPATVSEKASFPRKLIWLVVGTFGGLLISASIVLLRASWVSDPLRERAS